MGLEKLVHRLHTDSSFMAEFQRDPKGTLEREGCDPSSAEMAALLSTIGRWDAAPGRFMAGPMLNWYGPVKPAVGVPQLNWYGPAKVAGQVPQLNWYGPAKAAERVT